MEWQQVVLTHAYIRTVYMLGHTGEARSEKSRVRTDARHVSSSITIARSSDVTCPLTDFYKARTNSEPPSRLIYQKSIL